MRVTEGDPSDLASRLLVRRSEIFNRARNPGTGDTQLVPRRLSIAPSI